MQGLALALHVRAYGQANYLPMTRHLDLEHVLVDGAIPKLDCDRLLQVTNLLEVLPI
jgi:hypothetical protein